MGNLVKEKLQKGQKVIGTFFSMGNPSAMECLGYTGMDFAIIDTEHGPFEAVEDLMNVSGIGEKKLEGLRDRVTVTDGGDGNKE